jgi:hypothetical protein
MSDISGGNDKKIKQKTIAQAILEVMGETNRTNDFPRDLSIDPREKSLSF